MNIEEANDNLIMLKYFLQEEGDENWEKYCESIETLLTAYEKEKEKNFKRSDMCFLLKSENTKLKDEVKALENADLTTVYLNGVYDGEKKAKDKIKAKIEPVLKQLERKMQEEYNKYGNSREYQDIVDAYNFLQSLLEKE